MNAPRRAVHVPEYEDQRHAQANAHNLYSKYFVPQCYSSEINHIRYQQCIGTSANTPYLLNGEVPCGYSNEPNRYEFNVGVLESKGAGNEDQQQRSPTRCIEDLPVQLRKKHEPR